MSRLVVVLGAVCALGLTACSSDDGGGATGSETGSTRTNGNGACADLTGEGSTFTLHVPLATAAGSPPDIAQAG